MFTTGSQGGGNLIAMRPDKQLAGLLGLTDTATTLSNAYLLVDTVGAARCGHRRPDDPVPRHRRSLHAQRRHRDRHAVLGRDHRHPEPGGHASQRRARTAARPRPSPTTSRARSSTRARATRPGRARSATASRRRSAPTTSSSAAAGATPAGLGRPEQGRDPAGRRAAAPAREPDRADEPRPQAAAALLVPPARREGGRRDDRRRPRQRRHCGPLRHLQGAEPARLLGRRLGVRPRHVLHLPEHAADRAQAAAYVADGLRGRAARQHELRRLDAGVARPSSTTTSSRPSRPSTRALPAPSTNRTHCIAWSDWATQPKVELDHGIRLDTNYYYWPPAWVQNRPGLFTGSGMPMRFADLDGTMIDVYQATTQMTDESGQTYPFTSRHAARPGARRRRATTASSPPTCTPTPPSHAGSDAIVASAQARGVPVVSARQMLDWLDGRNGSSFGSLSWSGNTLSFTIDVGAGANGLRAMVPDALGRGRADGHHAQRHPVATVTRDDQGRRVRVLRRDRRHLRGRLRGGRHAAGDLGRRRHAGRPARRPRSPGPPTSRPTRASTTARRRGRSARSATESAPVTSHSVRLTGLDAEHHLLLPRHLDRRRGQPRDLAAGRRPAGSFTTPSASFTDTTVADFGAGTTGANDLRRRDRATARCILSPAVGAEFSGAEPAARLVAPRRGTPAGGATVSGGRLIVDGARLGTDQTLRVRRRSLEFVATFGGGGLPARRLRRRLQRPAVWAMFSTKNDGSFYARTQQRRHARPTRRCLRSLLGSPHRYRIDWNAGQRRVLRRRDARSPRTRRSFGATADAPARERLQRRRPGACGRLDAHEPLRGLRHLHSRVFDAGESADWGALSLDRRHARRHQRSASASAPATRRRRTGAGARSRRSRPRAATSPATRATSSTGRSSTTANPSATPVLRDVTIGYAPRLTPRRRPSLTRSPAPNANDVAGDTNVTVQFSEPMNPATIDGSTLRLRAQGAERGRAGDRFVRGRHRNPGPDATSLAPNAHYHVTVSGSVEDANGNALGADDDLVVHDRAADAATSSTPPAPTSAPARPAPTPTSPRPRTAR